MPRRMGGGGAGARALMKQRSMKLKPQVERPVERTRLHMAELKRFKQLDLNHDGSVSLDEWREYIQREDPDATEEEVQETFYAMDENQDGEVQFEESIKHAAINIKRSIAALKSWNGDMATNTPGTLKGYYALTMYALFFGIFVYVVIEQLKIEDQYPIDQVVRNTLLDQDGAMSTIAAHEDFFNYLLADFDPKTQKFQDDTYPNGGVFSTLFKDEHYNGEKLAPGDLGMLYQYNKLVGGVQISQKRGKLKECPPSSYALFYPTCYDKEEMITAEPCRANPGEYQDCKLVVQNTTRAKKVCGADDMKMQLDKSQTELYEQYLKDVKASQFGDRASLERGKSKIVKESFEYRYDEEGGFVAWLSLADGPDLNRKKIQTLKDELWLDLYTREVSVKFIFYNGNAGTFSYVSISFTFNTYGMYNTYNPDYSSVQRRGSGGSRIEIGSLNMEPYITAEDHGRLGVELVFMIFVFYYVASLLFDVALALYHRKVYQFVEAYGLPYLVMDVANMSCHLAFIVYRIDILRHIICNPVRVPTPSYNLVFEELSTKRQEQLMINFWSILLGMLRFFKYYQFQPRLQIVGKTLTAAAVHLFHFMVLFLLIHVTFSMIGFLNFGAQSRDFSSLTNALQVMAEAVLSGAFDLGPMLGNNSLAYIDPIMGNLFFQIWAFLVQMILLNIFVAILMDGYAEAQEEGKNSAMRMGLESPPSIAADIVQWAKLAYGNIAGAPKSWDYNHFVLQVGLQRLDERLPDPGYDEKQLKKELECLREVQELAQKRIEWLEKMCDPDNPMYARATVFHPFWHKKKCELQDIANEFPQFDKNFQKSAPTLDLMMRYYSDFCHSAFNPDAVDENGERKEDPGDVRLLQKIVQKSQGMMSEKFNWAAVKIQARARGMKVRDIATKKMLAVEMPTEFQEGVSRNIFH